RIVARRGPELTAPGLGFRRRTELTVDRRRLCLGNRRQVGGNLAGGFGQLSDFLARTSRFGVLRLSRHLRRRWGLPARDHYAADPDVREPLIEESRHFPVARACRCPAHDDADQSVTVAPRRCCEIEARSPDVAGFYPVCPLIPIEQMVVREDDPAAEEKLACREIAIFARKVVVERKRQLRHVARCGALLRVRQTGGIAVDRVDHPELTCPGGHTVRKGRL